jgi:hypothetical protein
MTCALTHLQQQSKGTKTKKEKPRMTDTGGMKGLKRIDGVKWSCMDWAEWDEKQANACKHV